ncbi:hypothetical protein ABIF67_006979 [Bradyrhizobium japonicum]
MGEYLVRRWLAGQPAEREMPLGRNIGVHLALPLHG